MKNIPVGDGPVVLVVDVGRAIYVANFDSNSVSVINTTTNALMKNIPVGHVPISLDTPVVGQPDVIYVANYDSNSVSIIDTTTNALMKNISVGVGPISLVGHGDGVYVANQGSNGVSLINSMTEEVVAKVTFGIFPFRSGDIVCNQNNRELHAPTDHFVYIPSGTRCVANAIKGFEFSSWREILSGNLSRTVNVTSGSPWNSVLDTFNLKQDDPSATITLDRFGNFTAYFNALPPPLPPQYWASLFTVVVIALIGTWLTPTIIGWRKEKSQRSKLDFYLKKIKGISNGDNQSSDLEVLKDEITSSYATGKINKEQYDKLTNDISIQFKEILQTRIKNIDTNLVPMDKIKEDVEDAYSNGKLTKLHYKLLNERISKLSSKEDSRSGS